MTTDGLPFKRVGRQFSNARELKDNNARCIKFNKLCYGSSYYDISRNGGEAASTSIEDNNLPEFIDPAYESHFVQFTQDKIKINELLESNRLTSQNEDAKRKRRNYGVIAVSSGERSPDTHQGYNTITIG